MLVGQLDVVGAASAMPQRGEGAALPVETGSLLGHHVHVAMFQVQAHFLADDLAAHVPLIDQGEVVAGPGADDHAAFSIPVAADSCLRRVVVLVELTLQVASDLTAKVGNRLSHRVDAWHRVKLDDRALTYGELLFLMFLTETQIVPRILVLDNASEHGFRVTSEMIELVV